MESRITSHGLGQGRTPILDALTCQCPEECPRTITQIGTTGRLCLVNLLCEITNPLDPDGSANHGQEWPRMVKLGAWRAGLIPTSIAFCGKGTQPTGHGVGNTFHVRRRDGGSGKVQRSHAVFPRHPRAPSGVALHCNGNLVVDTDFDTCWDKSSRAVHDLECYSKHPPHLQRQRRHLGNTLHCPSKTTARYNPATEYLTEMEYLIEGDARGLVRRHLLTVPAPRTGESVVWLWKKQRPSASGE